MRIPRPRAHWTPAYVMDRLALAAWQARHPGEPWLVPGAVRFLDQWLRPADVLVEFGSGRSTVWFARRVGLVISVEHDSAWHAQVAARLRAQGLTNVRYHLAQGKIDPHRPVPLSALQDPAPYIGAAMRELSACTADARADVVLVDGCSRDRCALWALGRLRPGGLLVVDNANWFLPSRTRAPASVGPGGSPLSEEWAAFGRETLGWRRVWHTDGVTDTVLYFAPAGAGEPGPHPIVTVARIGAGTHAGGVHS